MFINKAENGRNNLCGERIAEKRKEMGLSQRQLAEKMQISGIDIDKNAIQRIEAGKRFVTDIELKVISGVLDMTLDRLLR